MSLSNRMCEYFDLNNTEMSRSFLQQMIDNIPTKNVEVINFTGCIFMSNDVLENITPEIFPKLNTIILSGSNVTTAGLIYICSSVFPFIEHVHFASCKIDDLGIAHLTNGAFPNMTLLSLHNTDISDTGLMILSSGKQILLTRLIISNCRNISDYGINYLCHSEILTKLDYLDISYCEQLSNDTLSNIAKRNGINFRYINITGCEIDEKGISELYTSISKSVILKMGEYRINADEFVRELVEIRQEFRDKYGKYLSYTKN